MISHRHALVGVLTAVTVVAALAVPAAGAVDDDCPVPLSPDEVTRGMTGTGYTVAEGRERETFSVEVTGVLPDALGPGRDMIVIEANGDVIEDNGGIWGGMSGSPIFVEGKLLGAIAFALAYGPANVAGVTPASEMYKVLDYPAADESSSTRMAPRRVLLPDAMRQRIAYSAQMEPGQVGGSLRQLRIPVSISGVSGRSLDQISGVFERENLPLIPYAGSASAGAAGPTSGEVRPGDNFVAAMSYGDITFAGIGTATFVCRGRVMAFGHPMLWEGDLRLGANAADSLTIIQDPFFSYELATIAEGLGTIDQDRFAGLRGMFGPLPAQIPVESSIHALNTDRTRDGRTDVMVSEMLPFLAYYHLSSNMLMTMDEWSEGTADLAWSISGTRADGTLWSLGRQNLYASEWGIADEAVYELSNYLNLIHYNQFEDVEFTGVTVDGTADDEIEQYTLTGVQVSRDGVDYADRQRVRVRPGDRIYLRVDLKAYSGLTRTVDMSVRVPRRARTDGYLELRGGGQYSEEGEICLYDPTQCVDEAGKRIESFDDLLANLAGKAKNNELLAKLRMGRRSRVKSQAVQVLDQVVRGEAAIFVRVVGARRGGAGGGGGVVAEPGGGGEGY